MTEPIFIGARGWNGTGEFYPDILPDDWRLSFYATYLRAVLVPAETWEQADTAQAQAWLEDTYEEFRFVLEVPWAGFDVARPAEVLRSRLAGWLLRVPADATPTQVTAPLQALAAIAPVCVDLPASADTPDMRACLAQSRAGICWHAETQAAPVPGGKWMVTLSSTQEPRAQRRILEALHRWQGEDGIAALFFDQPEKARQARLLAELMVV
jgi:uncharacterized protein YecE (DUF72 family)